MQELLDEADAAVPSPWSLCMGVLIRWAGTRTICGKLIRDRRGAIWATLASTVSSWVVRERRRRLVMALAREMGEPTGEPVFDLIDSQLVGRMLVQLYAYTRDPAAEADLANMVREAADTGSDYELPFLRPFVIEYGLVLPFARNLVRQMGAGKTEYETMAAAMMWIAVVKESEAQPDELTGALVASRVQETALAAVQRVLLGDIDDDAVYPTMFHITQSTTLDQAAWTRLLEQGLLEVMIGLLDRLWDDELRGRASDHPASCADTDPDVNHEVLVEAQVGFAYHFRTLAQSSDSLRCELASRFGLLILHACAEFRTSC